MTAHKFYYKYKFINSSNQDIKYFFSYEEIMEYLNLGRNAVNTLINYKDKAKARFPTYEVIKLNRNEYPVFIKNVTKVEYN